MRSHEIELDIFQLDLVARTLHALRARRAPSHSQIVQPLDTRLGVCYMPCS